MVAFIGGVSIILLLDYHFRADDLVIPDTVVIKAKSPMLSKEQPIEMEIAEVIADPAELTEPESSNKANTAVIQPQEFVEVIDVDSNYQANDMIETGHKTTEVEFIDADDVMPVLGDTSSNPEPQVDLIDANEYFAKNKKHSKITIKPLK